MGIGVFTEQNECFQRKLYPASAAAGGWAQPFWADEKDYARVTHATDGSKLNQSLAFWPDPARSALGWRPDMGELAPDACIWAASGGGVEVTHDEMRRYNQLHVDHNFGLFHLDFGAAWEAIEDALGTCTV